MSESSGNAEPLELDEGTDLPGEPPPAPPVVATPEEHAAATDNVKELRGARTINGKATIGRTLSAAHMAAAQLHGWEAHKAATVEPFQLTREDYAAALKVAQEGGSPHAPALSPYAPQYQPASAAKPVAAFRKGRR